MHNFIKDEFKEDVECSESKYSRSTYHIEIFLLLFNDAFRRDVEEVGIISEPLVKVLMTKRNMLWVTFMRPWIGINQDMEA